MKRSEDLELASKVDKYLQYTRELGGIMRKAHAEENEGKIEESKKTFDSIKRVKYPFDKGDKLGGLVSAAEYNVNKMSNAGSSLNDNEYKQKIIEEVKKMIKEDDSKPSSSTNKRRF